MDVPGEGDLDFPVATVPVTGVTELRVHGVGGTPPAQMLGDDEVRQVTGDAIAGMWRGRDLPATGPAYAMLSTRAGGWHREAYSWGGLTSRATRTALWLMLVPFTMVNLAGWMAVGRIRRAGRPIDWRIGLQQALVRVLALAATQTYVLFTAQISMDLGAWQCTQVATHSCRLSTWPQHVWLSQWLPGHPDRSVVIASLVPLALLAVLFRLSGASHGHYEDYQGGTTERLKLPSVSLADPLFWRGAAYARRSRRLHPIASVALIATLLAYVARWGGTDEPLARAVQDAGLVFLAVCWIAAGWDQLRRLLFDGWRTPVTAAIAGLLLVAAGALAWRQPASSTTAPGIMPGIVPAFDALLLGVFGAAALLWAVSVAGRIAAYRSGLRGLPVLPGPFTTTAVGMWLGLSVWTAFTMWVARWLSPDAAPLAENSVRNHLLFPSSYRALASATVTVLVLFGAAMAVVAGAAMVLVSRRSALTRREESIWAAQAAPAPDAVRAGPGFLGTVRRAVWFTGVAHGLEWVLSALALITTAGWITYGVVFILQWTSVPGLLRVLGAVIVIGAGITATAYVAVGWSRGAAAVTGLAAMAGSIAGATLLVWPLRNQPQLRFVVNLPWSLFSDGVSITLLTLVPVGFVLMLRQALRQPDLRRHVGIAWDVATFWPRSFHPLAPPSYAERAVPELKERVVRLLQGESGEPGAVLLAGHSQGAIVSVATALQLGELPPQARSRLAVVTYGNPIRHLYRRFFPHYITDEMIAAAPRLGTDSADPVPWTNFHRHTDYIGRNMFDVDDPAERFLVDPPTDWHRRTDGAPRVRAHAHDGYEKQSEFAAHLTAEVTRLGTSARAETARAETAPSEMAVPAGTG